VQTALEARVRSTGHAGGFGHGGLGQARFFAETEQESPKRARSVHGSTYQKQGAKTWTEVLLSSGLEHRRPDAPDMTKHSRHRLSFSRRQPMFRGTLTFNSGLIV
jgi:hypothetical protein